jgi:hypothetical protein
MFSARNEEKNPSPRWDDGGQRPDEVNREPRQTRERRIDADNFPAQTSPHGNEIRSAKSSALVDKIMLDQIFANRFVAN